MATGIGNVEYALMAANVYGLGNATGVRSVRNTLPVPNGWEELSYTVNDGRTGFMAASYRAAKGVSVINVLI